METLEGLTVQVKQLILDVANLQDMNVESFNNDTTLFQEGLGLDSIDLLELVVNLDKKFGLKIKNDEQGRKVLANVGSIANAIYNQPGRQAHV